MTAITFCTRRLNNTFLKRRTNIGRGGGVLELKELIQSVDIIEYISQFVDLTLKGEEYWGLSPFKDEKTPSFSVKKDPPFFYDYSSGIGGNLYTFVKEYNHCSNRETVEIIKKYAGYEGNVDVRDGKMAATLDCKRYMKPKSTTKQSSNSTVPSDYMTRYEKRDDKLAVWEREGISREVLDRFEVYYDGFSDRLVYPIRNLDGYIVNVGGRALDPKWKEKQMRKYTYLFSWGGAMAVIYGLYENMEAILKSKEVIIFEGCKSVLIASTWGIQNCAALLTSHLNPNQMKILARLGCRVVFALDKEVDIRRDKQIDKLRRYVNCEYLFDSSNLLEEKDSPVDKGEEVFKKLYGARIRNGCN